MSAAFDRRPSPDDSEPPPARDSGVRACRRQEDIDTLPPPPPDLDDVHKRDTVNRKMTPELIAYLQSFEGRASLPDPTALDPTNPTPWGEQNNDGPVIDVAEHFEDVDTLLGEPAQPAALLAPSFEAEIEADEVPSFRDNRAVVALVGVALLVAGIVGAVLFA